MEAPLARLPVQPMLLFLLLALPAPAQEPVPLNESCQVLIGNQSVQVGPDGTFLVGGVPVLGARPGGTAVPFLVRARVTCTHEGEIVTGHSRFFVPQAGNVSLLSEFLTGGVPEPESLSISTPVEILGPGESVQLLVEARAADGTVRDVTPRSEGTTYLPTSGTITVGQDGLVTNSSPGGGTRRAAVLAFNEGTTASLVFTLLPPPPDSDSDGMPDEFEDLFGLDKLTNDAAQDLDSDLLTNLQEFLRGTLPNVSDTDTDGILDGQDGDPLRPEEFPPMVAILSPSPGTLLFQGQVVVLSAVASDDGLLTRVEFETDSGFSVQLAAPPFEVSFVVPSELSLRLTVRARDTAGNVSTAIETYAVMPDNGTTVVGLVLDPLGSPVVARVESSGQFVGASEPDGTFEIPGVPAALGEIQVGARGVVGGQPSLGRSIRAPAINGGITDVGSIQVGRSLALLVLRAFSSGCQSEVLDFDLVARSPETQFCLDEETILGSAATSVDGALAAILGRRIGSGDVLDPLLFLDLQGPEPRLVGTLLTPPRENLAWTPHGKLLIAGIADSSQLPGHPRGGGGDGLEYVAAIDHELGTIVSVAVLTDLSDDDDEPDVAVAPDGLSALASSPTNEAVHLLALSPDGTLTDTGVRADVGFRMRQVAIRPTGDLALVSGFGTLVAIPLTPDNLGTPVTVLQGGLQLFKDIAFLPNGSRAYLFRTGNPSDNLMTFAIDPLGNVQLESILPLGGQFRTGTESDTVVVSREGTRVVVIGPTQFVLVSPASGMIEARIPIDPALRGLSVALYP